jgi:hypothetical protein
MQRRGFETESALVFHGADRSFHGRVSEKQRANTFDAFSLAEIIETKLVVGVVCMRHELLYEKLKLKGNDLL